MASIDELLATVERRPDEEWLAHQNRLANLVEDAQELGPEHGIALLRRVWMAAEYRDVFWQIARLVKAWGVGSVSFLRARLADDPERALGVIVDAKSYGGEGLDALLPDVSALASSSDPDLAHSARNTRDWLDGTRD